MLIKYSMENLKQHVDKLLSEAAVFALTPSDSRSSAMLEGLGYLHRGFDAKQPMPPGSASKMGPRQFVDSIEDLPDDRLWKWYSAEWQELIIRCMEYAVRRIDDSRSFWFEPYLQFIEEMLVEKPRRELFFGHGISDGISGLDFRDKVIQPEGIYHLGWLLLEQDAQRGYDLLWDKLSLGTGGRLIGEILGVDPGAVRHHERVAILDTAWSILSRCHDLVYFSPGTQLTDHAIIAETILERAFRGVQKGASKNTVVAVRLAESAIRHHCEFLRIVETGNGGTISPLELPATWHQSALGAFLGLTLVLHEIAVRICWYPTHEGEPVDSRPEGILLVREIRVHLGPDTRLEFIADPLLYNRVFQSTVIANPLNEEMRESLKRALGPACLGLVPEEIRQVSVDWIKSDGADESQHRQPGSQYSAGNPTQAPKLMVLQMLVETREMVRESLRRESAKIETANPRSTRVMKQVRDRTIRQQKRDALLRARPDLEYLRKAKKRLAAGEATFTGDELTSLALALSSVQNKYRTK